MLRMTYLTKEDWNFIELSLDKEQLRYYNSIYAIMNSLSTKLKYSNQTVTSTAMIYFHKYTLTLKEKRLNGLDKVFICAACLFISTKATNRLVSLREIIVNMRLFILDKAKVKAVPFTDEELKAKVETLEQEVLEQIGFDTNFDLPYRLLPKIKDYFEQHIDLNVKNIINLCCYYINDSFSLPLCLYFIPDVIAIACVFILTKKFSIKVSWEAIYNLSHFVISDDEMSHCEKVINLLFESRDQRMGDIKKEAVKGEKSVVSNAQQSIVIGDNCQSIQF